MGGRGRVASGGSSSCASVGSVDEEVGQEDMEEVVLGIRQCVYIIGNKVPSE